MSSVALLGGAGFIGTNVAEQLGAHGHCVTVLDSSRRLGRAKSLLSEVRLVATDGANNVGARNLEGIDVLIHLGWSSQPANSMNGMLSDASNNIVGSLNLFTLAVQAGVKKIVFASSGGTVYGNVNHTPIDESHPLNPVSAYGVSKAAVERYLQLVAFHHGLTGISLRIGNPFGPYQFAGTPIGVIANFMLQVRAGAPLRIYGDGKIIRDYIWIDDVGRAFLAATECDLRSGEYNVGLGEGYTVEKIADLVEQVMGQTARREHVAHRAFDAHQIVLSTSKLKDATGWRPSVSFMDGLDKMQQAMTRL